MHYTNEDSARLYNTAREREKSRSLTWWEWIIVAAFAMGAGVTHDADNTVITAEAEQVALETKQALMGMPCTWIAQCSRHPCPIGARRCTDAADLRSAPGAEVKP